MSFVGSNILAGASGQGGADYKIERSLRFNSADSAYLNKTPSSAGNQKKFTWSGWIKRTEFGGNKTFFSSATSNTSNPRTDWQFYDDTLYITFNPSGSSWLTVQTIRKFRDPSAWYHIVVAVDTTQGTNTDRVKIYVNGVRETNLQNYSTITQNSDLHINSANQHSIGRYEAGDSNYFPGYIAEVHFIDGQALAPTDFGKFDDNNVWQPKEFDGTYTLPDTDGSSSPSVFTLETPNVDSTVAYINSNPTSSSYPLIQSNVSTGNYIKIKFASTQTSVTSIKFRGGGYSASSTYTLKVNGNQIGGTHNTVSGWGEATHTISSTDIDYIEITGSDGFAVGQLKFNDSLVPGTPSYGTLGSGDNSYYLDFSDYSSNATLGNDKSGLATTLPCVDFDGTNDVVSSADHSDYTLGTNDWTIEYFVKANSFETYDATVCKYGNSSYAWWQAFSAGGALTFYLYDTNGTAYTVQSSPFAAGEWTHLAVVRDGNTMRMYKDGVQQATANITGITVNDSTAAVTIGEDADGNYDFSGQISNVRIVNGTCLYANGTTFTVPSTPLTNVTYTKLLCCQSSTSVTEAAVSPNTLTSTGDPTAAQISDRAWTVNNLKATDAFGITSAASISSSKTIDFPITYGTTVTYEFFVQVTTASTYTYFAHDVTSQDAWNIGINSSNQLLFGNYNGGWTTFSSVGIGDGNWHFVRITTTGSSTSLYVDGSLVGTNSSGGSVSTGSQITNRLQSGAFKIAHLRITNGGTPPTVGIPAISSMNQAAGSGGTLAFYDALDDIASSGTKTSDGGNVTITMSAGTAGMIQHDVDTVIDTPTNYEATGSGNNGGNYCVLNFNANADQTLKNGNLVSNGVTGRSVGTIYVSSGKYYWEMKAGSTYTMAGIESSLNTYTAYPGGSAEQYALYGDGNLYHNGNVTTYTAFNEGDVLGFLLDMDAGELRIRINNTAINSGNAVATGLTGKSWTANCRSGSGSYNGDSIFNFGQQPFSFAPPSGYKSLCTTNLPEPTIADGSTAMDVKLWTGDDTTSRAITGLNFSPDLLWIKSRSSSGWHVLADNLRGAGKILASNATNSEYDNTDSQNAIQSFDSNGFTIGDQSSWLVNDNNITTVGWAWDGGDLATTSDTTNYNQSQSFSAVTKAGSTTYSPTDSDTGFLSAYPTSNAFNSSGLSQVAYSNNNNVWIYVQLSTAITVSSTIKFGARNTVQIKINGTDYSYTGGDSTANQTTRTISFSGSLTEFAIRDNDNSGYSTGLSYLEVDGKQLIDLGVIPAGSLNSSIYDRSKLWSSLVTTSSLHSSYNSYGANSKFGCFDGKRNTSMYSAGGPLTITFDASAFPASSGPYFVEVETNQRGIKVNGQPSSGYTTDIAANQATYWANNGSVSSLTSVEINQASNAYGGMTNRIRVNGKVLADSINNNVTWSNALTALSNSSLTNPSNGFDGDESTYADSTAGFTLDLSGHTFGTGTHTIEVKSGGASSFTVNGSTSLSGSGSGAIVWSGTHTGELTSLVSSATGASIYYIKVNGEYLLDPGQDFVDNYPSIGTTVRANPTAGMSIVSWQSRGTNNDSVAHGLNKKPDFWIMKTRSASNDWYAYTDVIDGSIDYLALNKTDSKNNSSSTAPTSNVFHVYGSVTNTDGYNMIGYVFNAVEGYSSFGTYTGNGSANGPFVYTGFKPRWIMGKRTDSTNDWFIYDTERETFNVQDQTLYPNLNSAEDSGGYYYIDIYSNGFKLRSNYAKTNASSATYLYAAFAEHPFNSSRAR